MYGQWFVIWLCLWPSLVLASKPNILLIVSEDNGPELGCYGDRFARTPHLDQLARQGTRFNRAFVPQAGCSQSRASFLTGLYPHQHGQIGLATWGFRLYRDEIPNLPRSLKALGYRTGILGKLHVNPETAFPFDFSAIPTANFTRKELSNYTRFAESFMTSDDRPFFLSVNYPDAHDPWIRQIDGLPKNPINGSEVQAMSYMGIDPPNMREMVADYYNSIARLDALVGDLLDALERSGKAKDTLVIYIGDHGADMLRGKRTCYDGGLRIPFLIRWPNKIQPQVREELVTTLDLLPTILRAAGADRIPDLPGMDLHPLFTTRSGPWRTHLFAEYHTHAAAPNYFPQRCIRTDRYKLIENLLPGEFHPDYTLTLNKLAKEAKRRQIPGGLNLSDEIQKADKTVREAYERMHQPPRYELYDLKTDPHEFINLVNDPKHTDIVKELATKLVSWREETKDPLLKQSNLLRLTDEVRSMKSKDIAKDYRWGYPNYFFGIEPATGKNPPKKKKSNS